MAQDPPLLCSLVIDENDEVICGETAESEILVRNRFGLFVVALCKLHKQEHRSFYRQSVRIRNPKRYIRKETEDVNACDNSSLPGSGVLQNA